MVLQAQAERLKVGEMLRQNKERMESFESDRKQYNSIADRIDPIYRPALLNAFNPEHRDEKKIELYQWAADYWSNNWRKPTRGEMDEKDRELKSPANAWRNTPTGRPLSSEQEFTRRLLASNPEMPAAEYAEAVRGFREKNRNTIEIERRTESKETDPKSPTYGDHAASYDAAVQEVIGNEASAKQSGKPLTINQIKAAAMKQEIDDAKTAKGSDLSGAEMRELFDAWTPKRPLTSAQGQEQWLETRTKELMRPVDEGGLGLSQTQARKEAMKEMASETEKAKATAREEAKQLQGKATLNDDAARQLAKRLISGDYSATSALGYGASGAANRAKVLNLAAEMDPGGDWAEKHLEFLGQGAAWRALGTQEARITAAVTKAIATSERVLETSDKINRSKFPSINSITQAVSKGTGGEDIVQFSIALESFANNYAAAMGQGNSVMTDNARNQARGLLETKYAQGQIRAGIEQMRKEMDSELKGVKDAKEFERSGTIPRAEGAVPKGKGPPSPVKPGSYIWTPGGGLQPAQAP
jgi:hypothetical protein